MVRALPDKKAHSDKNKGTEPLGRKIKEKQTKVEDNPTQLRKKYLKELPVGVLPKTGNPNLEKEMENDNVAVLLELEKQIERQHPPKLAPNVPPYPRRRTYRITNPPNGPQTRGGGSDADTQYENYPRGMWGGMVLFSVFLTFLVSWSPGVTLLWVAILTIFLLTLTECRTRAKNIFKRTLLQLITLADQKLGLKYLDDIQGGGNMDMRVHPLNV
jgi:hypothetical protein